MARSMLINSWRTRDNLWFFVETIFFLPSIIEELQPKNLVKNSIPRIRWAKPEVLYELTALKLPFYVSQLGHGTKPSKNMFCNDLQQQNCPLPSELWVSGMMAIYFGSDCPPSMHMLFHKFAFHISMFIHFHQISAGIPPQKLTPRSARYVNTTSTENNHLFVVQKEKTKPRFLRFC